MATVSTATILLLLEASFCLTAKGIVIIPSILEALTSRRIRIGCTILLSTCPTPRSTAALAYMEFIIVIKPAGKDIITRSILETPSLAPGALLRIRGTGIRHFYYGGFFLCFYYATCGYGCGCDCGFF